MDNCEHKTTYTGELKKNGCSIYVQRTWSPSGKKKERSLAYYFVQFGVVQRSNGGSAMRRSAYQRCANNAGFDFSAKAKELASHGVMLPAGAAPEMSDPVRLWTAAEGAEKRVDAQLSRTFEISIPNEIPQDLRDDFTRHVLEPFVARGFAVEWSRHDVDALFEDVENPHIHAQMSLRHLGPDGFSAKKDREFNGIMTRNNGADMRAQLADRMNTFCQENDINAAVSHLRETMITETSSYVRKQMKVWKASGLDESAQPPQLKEFLEERAQAIELKAATAELHKLEAEVACLKAEQPAAATRPDRQQEIMKTNDINMKGFIDDDINKDSTFPAIGQLGGLRSSQTDRPKIGASRTLDSNADRRDRSNTTYARRNSRGAKSVDRAVSKIAELVVRFLFSAILAPPVVDLADLLKAHFGRGDKVRNDPKINRRAISDIEESFRVHGSMVYLERLRELARAGKMVDIGRADLLPVTMSDHKHLGSGSVI